jgi:solute:Na+ symporter, SSS family
MTSFDLIVVIAYFVLVAAIGMGFRGQASLHEFFLGSRDIPWWAAMLSGIATIVSGISYLGAPAVRPMG